MPNDGDLLDLMLDRVPDEATRNRILLRTPTSPTDFSAQDVPRGRAAIATPSIVRPAPAARRLSGKNAGKRVQRAA